MRHLTQADYRRTPWKNGGGETVELAAFPEGATLDAFIWRLSMARIDGDGPFSTFEGVDRSILVHTGAGIVLTVDGVETALRRGDRPFAFSGDAATACRLLDGAVIDINVMSRRSLVRHGLSLAGPSDTIVGRDHTLVLALTPLRLAASDIEVAAADLIALAPGEKVRIAAGEAMAVHFEPMGAPGMHEAVPVGLTRNAD